MIKTLYQVEVKAKPSAYCVLTKDRLTPVLDKEPDLWTSQDSIDISVTYETLTEAQHYQHRLKEYLITNGFVIVEG